MTELFFDDFFKVEGLNPYNEKYDKVSRIVARSEKHNMYMLLDVNTEIYPLNIGERFLLALSPSLVLNTKDGPVSIQEKFEYIMHGREVYASYGGLQMMLRGDPSHCVKFAVDQNLYLLIRKA
ncbi:unnamed protein product [Trifolium pratense]|uniref:Uncharacterized protein n=1 Tax=Trifolium pratense TaxID=57577 RepID=A0ACB0KRI8_TRIPR|nr:unnamed protein product [Trifolium pratense]